MIIGTAIGLTIGWNAGSWHMHSKLEKAFSKTTLPREAQSVIDMLDLWKMDEEDQRTANQLMGQFLVERARDRQ